MMKASPDGKLLCQTHFPELEDITSNSNFCQLFDFDNLTGILSNVRTLSIPGADTYACEFSPDSKLLYLLHPKNKTISQVEAKLGSASAIVSSAYTFSTGTAGYFAAQMAPDQKIYLSFPSQFLGAINNPNVKGSGCSFRQDQIQVAYAFNGLPAFINDLSSNPVNGFDYTIIDSCEGTVQFQGFSMLAGNLQWLWDFGDGQTSTMQNPIHDFNPANKYYNISLTINSSVSCDNITRTKTILPSGSITQPVDFEIVNRCDSGYVRFINLSGFIPDPPSQFIWEFDDGSTSTELNPIHTYSLPGLYEVKLKLKTPNACLDDSATHSVSLLPYSIQALPVNRTVLIGEPVTLNVNGTGKTYQWTPSQWLSDPAVKSPVAVPLEDVTYTVTATNQDGCMASDSIKIKVLPLNDFYVPSGFTPDNNGRNDLIRPWFPSKYTLIEFAVFNRWGQKVYATNKRGAGWNGKLGGIVQQTGVYIWLIKAKENGGKTIERKGSFVLIN
jgi:gliding motility-associated-like protein